MTACSGGLLAHDRYQDICWYQKEAFGADFYLEVMPHNVDYGDGADQMEKVNTDRLHQTGPDEGKPAFLVISVVLLEIELFISRDTSL